MHIPWDKGYSRSFLKDLGGLRHLPHFKGNFISTVLNWYLSQFTQISKWLSDNDHLSFWKGQGHLEHASFIRKTFFFNSF
jgi:hypothetical protein